VLIYDPGIWIAAPTTTSYQWQRCDASGGNCADLQGSQSETYSLTDADLGTTLRLRLSATNSLGSTSVTTTPTIPILSPLATLALAYRPLLLFHLGDPAPNWDAEESRPLEIANFFAEPSAGEGSNGVSLCYQGSCSSLTDPEAQLSSANSTDAYLDIADAYDPCYHTVSTGATVYDCDSGSHTAMYFEPGQDSAAYRYLDYWFFYRDNHPGGTFGQLDDHDGDWEGMTVVLDGLSPGGVSLAYVWYAAHGGGQWYDANALAAAGALTGTHSKDFVARGTHASYPTACTAACNTPSNVPWPWEAPHDGGALWGANDDPVCGSTCVERFSQDWWTYWQGRWGASIGTDSWGWSPPSPGTQTRFRCAAWGYNSLCSLPRPPGSRLPSGSRRRTLKASSPRTCSAWFGGEVSVLACDPKLLRKAIRTHRMKRHGRLHVSVNGHRGGDSPGLAQFIGQSLVPGDRVTVTGQGTRRTIFLLSTRLGSRLFRVKFRYVDLVRSRRIRLLVGETRHKPVIRTHAGVTLPAKVLRLR